MRTSCNFHLLRHSLPIGCDYPIVEVFHCRVHEDSVKGSCAALRHIALDQTGQETVRLTNGNLLPTFRFLVLLNVYIEYVGEHTRSLIGQLAGQVRVRPGKPLVVALLCLMAGHDEVDWQVAEASDHPTHRRY